MITDLMQMEHKIVEINHKLSHLEIHATEAYKKQDYAEEDKYQKEINVLVAERGKLRLSVMNEYQTLRLQEWGEPERKKTDKPVAILFKLNSGFQQWVGGLNLREVTPEKEGTIYIKIDGTNDLTDKMEQIQIHASPNFVRDLYEGLSNAQRKK